MKTSVVYSRIFLAAMSLSLVILAGCGNTGPQSAKNNPAYDVRQPQIDEAFFALPERTVEIQTVESEATLTGAETEQLSGLSTQTIENRTFLRFEGHPLADYRIQYTTSGEEQQYSDLSLAELTTAFVQDMQVPHPGYTIGAEGLAVKYVVEKETEGEYFVYLTAGSGCGGCSRWFEYVLDVDTQHQRIEVLPVPADSARSYFVYSTCAGTGRRIYS
jgi:predicted small lipoprotein YifL